VSRSAPVRISVSEAVDRFAGSHDLDLLVPQLDLVRSWEAQGTKCHYLYVKRPVPLFCLEALLSMFRDALEAEGVEFPDKAVFKSTYEMRRNFGGGCKVPVHYLVSRWEKNGVTFTFWTRGVQVALFKGFALSEDPPAFVGGVLHNLDYPRYMVEDALRKGEMGSVRRILERVRRGRAMGWPLEL
jgi:hypothetical protein